MSVRDSPEQHRVSTLNYSTGKQNWKLGEWRAYRNPFYKTGSLNVVMRSKVY